MPRQRRFHWSSQIGERPVRYRLRAVLGGSLSLAPLQESRRHGLSRLSGAFLSYWPRVCVCVCVCVCARAWCMRVCANKHIRSFRCELWNRDCSFDTVRLFSGSQSAVIEKTNRIASVPLDCRKLGGFTSLHTRHVDEA